VRIDGQPELVSDLADEVEHRFLAVLTKDA
jgi:hypothetical protein